MSFTEELEKKIFYADEAEARRLGLNCDRMRNADTHEIVEWRISLGKHLICQGAGENGTEYFFNKRWKETVQQVLRDYKKSR